MFAVSRATAPLESFSILSVSASCPPAAAQEWVQPERTKANVEALARVQVKKYTFEAAGNTDMEYGLYLPTQYDAARPTPLVIALHGLGSGISYMMEYNNLVELAERYGYIVATPLGYRVDGWYGARGQDNAFNRRSANPGPENLGALSEQDVLNVLKTVRADFNVDSHRIISLTVDGRRRHVVSRREVRGHLGSAASMAPAIYISPDTLEPAKHLPVMVVQGDADRRWTKVTRRGSRRRAIGHACESIECPAARTAALDG